MTNERYVFIARVNETLADEACKKTGLRLSDTINLISKTNFKKVYYQHNINTEPRKITVDKKSFLKAKERIGKYTGKCTNEYTVNYLLSMFLTY